MTAAIQNKISTLKMTSMDLEKRLTELIQQDRRTTHEILKLINLALEQRSYLEIGYGSMFDWLVTGFGYSNAAAYRRIEAAKLLKSVPEVSKQLTEGRVNLSTLSKVQNVIKTQERISGQKVPIELKKVLLQKIEHKSILETEQLLVAQFPMTASTVHQDRKTVINENQIRHQLNLSNEASQNIQRAKEVLSHKFPYATDADIVTYAVEELLKRLDPLKKVENRGLQSATRIQPVVTSATEGKAQQSFNLQLV